MHKFFEVVYILYALSVIYKGSGKGTFVIPYSECKVDISNHIHFGSVVLKLDTTICIIKKR